MFCTFVKDVSVLKFDDMTFTEALNGLLSSKKKFTTMTWASTLNLSVQALYLWKRGETIPQPSRLVKILSIYDKSKGEESLALRAFMEMADQPIESISSEPSKFKGAKSVSEYIFKGIAEDLLKRANSIPFSMSFEALLFYDELLKEISSHYTQLDVSRGSSTNYQPSTIDASLRNLISKRSADLKDVTLKSFSLAPNGENSLGVSESADQAIRELGIELEPLATKNASEIQNLSHSMRIVVKNACCISCEYYVRNVIKNLGLSIVQIHAGEVYLTSVPSEAQLSSLDVQLKIAGMELVNERKYALVEKMKVLMREAMDQAETSHRNRNMSTYLSNQLNYNYSYLSNLFSEAEGQTIREFGITLRMERVKKMLLQDRDLLDIAIVFNYSSLAHLAAQFKKFTGMTTSEYKREMKRIETSEIDESTSTDSKLTVRK